MIKFTRLLAIAILSLSACAQDKPPEDKPQHSNRPDLSFPTPRSDVVEDRFALLALSCIHKEYPNKISHVMQDDSDIGAPHELTPAFYGCFDWHSSVHGHWLLVRVLNTDPDTPMRGAILAALEQSFTAENFAVELAYYTSEGRKSFERPYGISWFLQLVTELDQSSDPQLQQWRATLRPLENAIVSQVKAWVAKLAYPIRSGTHNQSAFGFGLMLDYAVQVGDTDLEAMITKAVLGFHQGDMNCPLAYEPSGEDFLSPCLMEADLMRRILGPQEFAAWLDRFLPVIPLDGNAEWLSPGIVLDATDGKLVHLDGVNLSRAWALEGIASGLPTEDMRIPSLLAAAAVHKETGIAAISDENYSGSHWLGSFALYLTTQRGLSGGTP